MVLLALADLWYILEQAATLYCLPRRKGGTGWVGNKELIIIGYFRNLSHTVGLLPATYLLLPVQIHQMRTVLLNSSLKNWKRNSKQSWKLMSCLCIEIYITFLIILCKDLLKIRAYVAYLIILNSCFCNQCICIEHDVPKQV